MNLFNHVLALLCAKFACILAFRYPVFRWELCNGCVWESVKKFKCVYIGGFSRLDLTSDLWLATRQNATCVKHVGSWRVTIVGTLQDKKGPSSLAVISRLIPVASKSPEHPILQESDFLHSSHYNKMYFLQRKLVRKYFLSLKKQI